MLLARINSTFPLVTVRGEVDRLFNQVFGGASSGGITDWFGASTYPPVNVWEDDQNIYAEAELPGLKMDDLEVLVQDNELTIKGERAPDERQEVSFHRRERGHGKFERVLTLPVDIDEAKVEARLRDGVLTVTLPKSEAVKPRKIEVKTVDH